jgi:hypothetical protein
MDSSYQYVQSLEYWKRKALVTRSEPAPKYADFFDRNAVSQIFPHCLKDFFCCEEINVVRSK